MACTASVRTLGKRALRLALLSLIVSAAIINGAVTVLAADGDDEAVLRIQGSNTVGAKLAPTLIAGLFEAQGMGSVRVTPAGRENEQRVSAVDSSGRTIHALPVSSSSPSAGPGRPRR